MRNGLSLWIVVLSLVLTRLTGLHLHACAGVESGAGHATAHYADNGFFFGEHHAEDDSDDNEVDYVTAVASKVQIDLDDFVTPIPTHPELVYTAKRLLSVAAPRGPPSTFSTHSPHFVPPLRGPPSHSLA
ncbi:MAG: hypothetical protein EPN60_09925 [Nevskiaceae bacterium]|nr:hypothetical protein [Stagnimonas sp.]TAM26573.1 MAG: hypothetical protein EPN60_09925 [Nevskiaceae bacterium]